MNKLLALVLVLGTAIAFAPKADAQCPSCELPGLLEGSYIFNLTGQAVLGDATSGTCSQKAGDVAAAITSASIRFDGNGNIGYGGSIRALSIGATSCTSFTIQGGHYSVESRGDGNFAATGIMNIVSSNPYSPCSVLALGSQPFVITGRIGGKELEIQTYGVDKSGAATYAEGPYGTKTTCQAPILNFITTGTAEKYTPVISK